MIGSSSTLNAPHLRKAKYKSPEPEPVDVTCVPRTMVWGETQAAAYVVTLVARFKWLAVNRSLWQARDDFLPGLYGRYEGRHLIDFRDGGDLLQIVRVFR